MISLNGIKNIGDFDLVEYCRRNFKIIIELFLNEVRNHKNINDLDNYKKYLMEEWSSLFDIKILLDEIEKLILNIVKEENLKKRERREKEIFERETREKERLEKERKLNMFKEKIRKERENKREIKKKEEQFILDKKLNNEKYSVYGNSGKTLSWLVNNSTLIEIKKLLNEDKITNDQYNNILDMR